MIRRSACSRLLCMYTVMLMAANISLEDGIGWLQVDDIRVFRIRALGDKHMEWNLADA